MSTINKVIPDSDVKQVLIEVLAFENSNADLVRGNQTIGGKDNINR